MGAGEPPPQSALRADSVSPAGSVGRWTTCHRHVAAPIGGAECAHPLVSSAGSVGSRQSATGARSPPPAPRPRRCFLPLWRGRGIIIYNLIPKGGAVGVSPAGSVGRWTRATGTQRPLWHPPTVYSFASQRKLSAMGAQRGAPSLPNQWRKGQPL